MPFLYTGTICPEFAREIAGATGRPRFIIPGFDHPSRNRFGPSGYHGSGTVAATLAASFLASRAGNLGNVTFVTCLFSRLVA
jgi:hypothetical protein